MDRRTERRRRARLELAGRIQAPVGFTYIKDGVLERRQIIPDAERPVRENEHGDPYVIGHDITRDGARSFRLDRIVRLP